VIRFCMIVRLVIMYQSNKYYAHLTIFHVLTFDILLCFNTFLGESSVLVCVIPTNRLSIQHFNDLFTHEEILWIIFTRVIYNRWNKTSDSVEKLNETSEKYKTHIIILNDELAHYTNIKTFDKSYFVGLV